MTITELRKRIEFLKAAMNGSRVMVTYCLDNPSDTATEVARRIGEQNKNMAFALCAQLIHEGIEDEMDNLNTPKTEGTE